MKKFIFSILMVLVCSQAWAVNKYPVIAGGNWNTDATWTLNSDGTTNATVKPTTSDDVFFNATSGNVIINANAVAKNINFTGYTGTLTQNAFSLSPSGSITFVSGMNYTPLETSTISFGSTGTLTTGTKLIPNLTASGGGQTFTLGDDLNFMNSPNIVFSRGSGGIFNLAGHTISGFSSINKVLIRTSTLGSAVSITVSGGHFSNADFRDITFSSATDVDLTQGGTTLPGDCGGNTITGGGTNLTFTTGATQTATGNSANWSAATWSGRVPLPQDNVVISLTAGQTLTADVPRLGKDISFGTATNLILGNAVTSYGSLDFTGMGTYVPSGNTYAFESGTRSGNININYAGKVSDSGINILAIGTTVNLLSAMTWGGSNTLSIGNGAFVDNGFTLTGGRFSSSGIATRAITKSGTWNISSTSTVWDFTTTTGLTFTDTGTTNFTSTSNSTKTFQGGNQTFKNVNYSGSGTGAFTFVGNNSFNSLSLTPTVAAANLVTFTAGSQQNVGSFTATGSSGKLITINSSSSGSPATLALTTGYFQGDYLSIKDSTVTPVGQWYAGNNSTLVSGNTGWVLGVYSPPSGGGGGSVISGSNDTGFGQEHFQVKQFGMDKFNMGNF